MANPILFFDYGYNVIFEPEYIDVLNYAVANGITVPLRDQNIKNNRKIKELKALGAFTELDLFYYFKQGAGLEEFCKINWVDPNLYFLTQPTPAQEPVFEPNEGFKGTFANSTFFSTGYVPSTDAVNAVIDDMSVMFKSYDEVLGAVTGTRNGSGNNFNVRKDNGAGLGDNTSMCAVTGNGLIVFDNASHIVHAKNGTTHNYYVNGSFDSSTAYASTTLSSVELTLFAWNFSGTPGQFFTGGIEYFALGSGFFNTIPTQMYNIMNK